MKEEAKKQLTKDATIAIITAIIAGTIMFATLPTGDISFFEKIILFIVSGIYFAGLPFGWKWASKIITAVSLMGILIKGLIALVLGWFALIIVIGGDIIRYVKAE